MMAMALAVLLLSPISAMAAACLSIDVPPQAVLSVYDGDTLDIFTFGPRGKVRLRVIGVDTPERNKKEPGWEQARTFTIDWLNQGSFTVKTCGDPTLDRMAATLIRGERTLAQALIDAGHQWKETP